MSKHPTGDVEDDDCGSPASKPQDVPIRDPEKYIRGFQVHTYSEDEEEQRLETEEKKSEASERKDDESIKNSGSVTLSSNIKHVVNDSVMLICCIGISLNCRSTASKRNWTVRKTHPCFECYILDTPASLLFCTKADKNSSYSSQLQNAMSLSIPSHKPFSSCKFPESRVLGARAICSLEALQKIRNRNEENANNSEGPQAFIEASAWCCPETGHCVRNEKLASGERSAPTRHEVYPPWPFLLSVERQLNGDKQSRGGKAFVDDAIPPKIPPEKSVAGPTCVICGNPIIVYRHTDRCVQCRGAVCLECVKERRVHSH